VGKVFLATSVWGGMLYRSACFAFLASLVVACAVPSDPEEDTANTSDELRALSPAEVVGEIGYGETRAGLAYDESLTYRALRFQGTAGDQIEINVRASGADARAWLLGSSYATLKSNDNAALGTKDARITHKIAKTGQYYIAFREKNYEDAMFSVSLRKTNALPPPPPVDDPFDPASCQGPTNPNLASLFSPGATKQSLGAYVAKWQSRECNDLTGCTAWRDEGANFAGATWAGPGEIAVGPSGFLVNLQGHVAVNRQFNTARCIVGSGGTLTCDSVNYLGTQFMALSGTIRQHCARVTGDHKFMNLATNKPSGAEYRVAMLVRF
jgi:hypothetical protein